MIEEVKRRISGQMCRWRPNDMLC